MNLVEKLTEQTQELKTAYIQKTIEWSIEEYKRLRDFANDFRANYDVHKEKKYFSLPACVVNAKGKVEEFTEIQVKKAEIHYSNSIEKLAFRIAKKGLNENNLKMSTTYFDPNISTIITDGEKTVSAYTIIASGRVQKPHYRYLIK